MRCLMIAMLCLVPVLNGCLPLVAGGAATALMVNEDRRTLGTVTEDNGIEIKVRDRIRSKYAEPHFNVTAYNRMVLLTGEMPDAATKADIEKIAAAVENVRGVHNEVTVGSNSPMSARANDSYITGRVKARFIDQNKFNVVHVKVVTEAGTVYLMGLVRRKEADDATQIARTTADVRKVVRLFEYID